MSDALRLLKRRDDRIVVHFDYDCFYASVVEAENPALKSLPLAVQQKQIVVTCNYEARRRGLRKLQLITEAKRICPDVVIVLGEDLTRFRDASKALYNLLRSYSWNDRVERLGFDEVWMDVTDIVEYNLDLLNENSLAESFFQLSRTDPTAGFGFDATQVAGYGFPSSAPCADQNSRLYRRLLLGSHLALHLRHVLEEQMGYTCTVGISTSKLLSKLVGNKHKPRGQTTLLPPYPDNVTAFLDEHDIGAIPYIGFKTAQKLRGLVLGRAAEIDTGLMYGGTREHVSVQQVRQLPGANVESLEKLLSGPGSPHGIGLKVFGLIHGIDDTEVSQARNIPHQISIEDSYGRLDTLEEVEGQLHSLSKSLVTRMRTDLTDLTDDEDVQDAKDAGEHHDGPGRPKWIGRPETLRLTTRPRPPLNADGTRSRTFKRISRSTPVPTFLFSLNEHADALASRLVTESLMPLFKKLHPERSGWNLSLLNVGVTNMIDAGGVGRGAGGRDIAEMFRHQDSVLDEFRVKGGPDPDDVGERVGAGPGIPDHRDPSRGARDVADKGVYDEGGEDGDELSDAEWDERDAADDTQMSMSGHLCPLCEERIPAFALAAHERFHAMGE